MFGANLVPPLLQAFNPLALLYALLSLTVIRMIPVAISLIGTRLRPDTTLIMGWFGPRGLASVVFALMAYESFHEAGRTSDTAGRHGRLDDPAQRGAARHLGGAPGQLVRAPAGDGRSGRPGAGGRARVGRPAQGSLELAEAPR